MTGIEINLMGGTYKKYFCLVKRLSPLFAAVVLVGMSCSPSKDKTPVTPAAPAVPAGLKPADLPGIKKVHIVSGLYLASQPDKAGFEAAKQQGIKTVINLRHDDEIEMVEQEVVKNLGLRYLHLPWNGAEQLTDEVFDKARALLNSADKPLLLHCKSANRVGAVWLPYRVLEDGVELDQAVKEAKEVGLKSSDYEAKALDYIERNSS